MTQKLITNTRTINRILKNEFYNVDWKSTSAFGGLHLLQRKFKGIIRAEDIKKFVDSQPIYTLNRLRETKFKRLPMVSHSIGWLHQDLSSTDEQLAKVNKRYLYVAVDSLSKFIFCYAINDKTSKSMISCVKNIMKVIKIHVIYCDRGSENTSREFKKFCGENDIKLIFSRNTATKAFLAENAIKRIRMMIGLYLDYTKNINYINNLQNLVKSVNFKPQARLGYTSPAKILKDKTLQKQIYLRQYKKYIETPRKIPKLSVGDKVRVQLEFDSAFSKNYKRNNFTEEIFIIDQVLEKKLPLYIIRDKKGNIIQGTFYERELSLVNE
jgi:transposase InsO family protein